MSQSGKDECDRFLERQEPWVKAVLTGEQGSPDIRAALAKRDKPGWIEELGKAKDEYEELLNSAPGTCASTGSGWSRMPRRWHGTTCSGTSDLRRQGVHLAENCRTLDGEQRNFTTKAPQCVNL